MSNAGARACPYASGSPEQGQYRPGPYLRRGGASPHSNDYASHLTFFTEVVTRLEARSARARQLVEERGRGLLERAFRVFSHLLNADPNFDFDAAIAPVPTAIRGDLAHWVEDNVDALVRAFTSEDDAVVVVADEGDVVDDASMPVKV